MRSNLCASTNSVFGIKIENEFHRQKERPEPEKWQVLSITNIHTYTCIMHTSNAYTVNQNQLVALAKQTSITFAQASSKLTTKFQFYHQRLHIFFHTNFLVFFRDEVSLRFCACLCVYADSVYVQPSKWIEISIFAFI